jgi:ABC-2 type transport system permease protein
MDKLLNKYWLKVEETWWVFTEELKRIFRDPGVMVLFFLATLAYPFLYNFIYWKDNIENVPVAVVDMSASPQSRAFLHRWNATPEVTIAYHCTSMAEAEQLMREQKIHGIIYFPADFETCLQSGLQSAHISLFCDMSSFMYLKAVFMSCNRVMLEDLSGIQVDRYQAMGYDKQFAWQLVQGIPYTETGLFCESGGYASFLVPAVLMLLLHQTLFFGICMLNGTAREEKKELFLIPGRRRGYSVLRIAIGKSAAYLLLYMAMGAFLLITLPRLFGLPHIGRPFDVLCLLVPYLLAVIFFAMSVSMFIRNRESGIVLLISTSLIFIFIAGVSWPVQMTPVGWRYVSYLFPYTWGVHGYLHIQSMGTTLAGTAREYIALWLLAGFYFLTTCGLLWFFGWRYDHQLKEKKESCD